MLLDLDHWSLWSWFQLRAGQWKWGRDAACSAHWSGSANPCRFSESALVLNNKRLCTRRHELTLLDGGSKARPCHSSLICWLLLRRSGSNSRSSFRPAHRCLAKKFLLCPAIFTEGLCDASWEASRQEPQRWCYRHVLFARTYPQGSNIRTWKMQKLGGWLPVDLSILYYFVCSVFSFDVWA